MVKDLALTTMLTSRPATILMVITPKNILISSIETISTSYHFRLVIDMREIAQSISESQSDFGNKIVRIF